jgi:hypothetical protein
MTVGGPQPGADPSAADLVSEKFLQQRPIQRLAGNDQVIRAFLALEMPGDVTRDALRERCEGGLGMRKFDAKYRQLKTDVGNSYGKVFYEKRGGVVRMWPVVREEVNERE